MISTKRDQDFYNDRYHEYRTNVRFTDENDLISDVVTLIAGEVSLEIIQSIKSPSVISQVSQVSLLI